MPTTSWREKAFLSARDIANILSIHKNTAYEIIHKLPHVVIGNTALRVATPAFEKWLKDNERSCSNA